MADGYRYQHGDEILVCEACGALVEYDVDLHNRWHAWQAQLVDDLRDHLAQAQPTKPDKAFSGAGQGPGIGWWVISGENLLAMLRRCHAGEDPDLVYAEEYANSEHHHQHPGEDHGRRREAQLRAALDIIGRRLDLANGSIGAAVSAASIAHLEASAMQFAAEVVDAVNAAGQGWDGPDGSGVDDTTTMGRTGGSGERATLSRGSWTDAVAALRDAERYERWCEANPDYPGRRVWSHASRHGLADYLEAVGTGRDEAVAAQRDRVACTCPDVDASGFNDPPGSRTVKGLDPNCAACRPKAPR